MVKLVLAFVLAASLGCSGGKSPEIVVQEFISLDLEGKRLTSDGMAELKQYVAWETGGFDTAYVVSDVVIWDAVKNGQIITYPITYTVIARYAGDHCYHVGEIFPGGIEVPAVLEESLDLERNNGIWRIQPPIPPYHIHQNIARDVLPNCSL